ncbi:hypothetical protein CI238_09835 [Colletotrichum incanum]|uniref:NADH:flavin oxidoreductase/NADH oxidase N-terminal domain-containing protein n=1 Tax=Colletotrichum incanum TaxID=1573173 RepID=A0A161WFQ0_COLIC|nr:hypothetical protein CI238_09835 [Colletotrichum incanum]
MWRHLVTLPNRLAKAAMAERFGGKDNLPGSKECLNACRQAPFTRSIAPSPVPLDLGSGIFPWLVRKLVYGTPSELTKFQIQDVVKQFVHAAKLSADAGFAGVEIHAAHGYLLSQFLSPASNQREDAYGGSPLARAKIVLDVIHEIRKAVPKTFIMGIKLNSADHQSSNDLRESIEQLKAITETGIDFIEISGGSIEDPKFSTGPNLEKKASTKVREAFFIEFANAIRHEIPHIPVMVTGGIRSRKGMEAIVSGNSCDLVGLARPSVINPMLPKEIILNPEVPDDEAVADAKRLDPWRISKYTSMKAIGTGRETLWYTKQIRRIGSQHGAVVLAGSGNLSNSIVDGILKHKGYAENYCGVYLLPELSKESMASKLPERAESAQHMYRLIQTDMRGIARIREIAGLVNKNVASGSIRPIQTFILIACLQTDLKNNRAIEGLDPTAKSLQPPQLLLTLLLLPSMNKTSGRIIVRESHECTKAPNRKRAKITDPIW